MNRFITSLMLCMLVLTAYAQQIDEQAAMQTARDFFKSSSRAKVRAKATSPMRLAYKSSKQGKTNYYVFNNGGSDGGFVIVGGDEAATPILGYCSEGTFVYDSLPDNFKWWLSQYDQQIGTAIANQSSAKARKVVASRKEIPNLIQTQWNQNNPYNSQIPTLGPGYKPFATGCVATAMAQVMYYHKCPATTGMGEPISFTGTWNTSEGKKTVTFAADFANTTYDWANMQLTYSSEADPTSASSVAVGTLMYHAGVSVEMDYGQDNSGAADTDILPALIRNFGYDKGGLYLRRDKYSDSEWEDMIYDELLAGRPILYRGGAANGSGHAFICHGYQEDTGLYAFNWGWGGKNDGYFAMTGADALCPKGSGIGGAGANAAYTNDQGASFGVQPDMGNDYVLYIVGYKDAVLSTTAMTEDQVTDITVKYGNGTRLYLIASPENFSLETMSFDIGVVLREKITGKTYYKKLSTINNLGRFYMYEDKSWYFIPEQIVPFNGEYEVYPVYAPVGSKDWKILRQSNVEWPVITMTGGQDDAKVDVDFTISDLEVQVARTATISHSEEYNGAITYTSSNPAVATVSEDGVVKGVTKGTATITAKAAGNVRYLATEKSFSIKVSETIKEAVSFTVSSSSLNIGETDTIAYSDGYDGPVSYTSSNTDVVTVTDEGVVSAVGEGEAVITAIADGDVLFKRTMQMLKITVSKAISIGDGIEFITMPVAGSGNYISASNGGVRIAVRNMAGRPLGRTLIYSKIDFGDGNYVVAQTGYDSWEEGETLETTLNISNLIGKAVFPGNTYTVEFYKDEDFTQPMNIPSIQVTCVEDITVDFKMTSVGYGTLCLPFDADVPAGLRAYECATYDEDGYAILTKATRIEHNTPYIMRGAEGTYSFTGPYANEGIQSVSSGLLIGVLSNDFTLQSSHYILQNHSGRVAFYYVGDGTRLGTNAKQYSCLMQIPLIMGHEATAFDGIKLPSDFEDDATGIFGIDETADADNVEIYSVGGLRLNSLQRGVNIVKQGTKVVKILK